MINQIAPEHSFLLLGQTMIGAWRNDGELSFALQDCDSCRWPGHTSQMRGQRVGSICLDHALGARYWPPSKRFAPFCGALWLVWELAGFSLKASFFLHAPTNSTLLFAHALCRSVVPTHPYVVAGSHTHIGENSPLLSKISSSNTLDVSQTRTAKLSVRGASFEGDIIYTREIEAPALGCCRSSPSSPSCGGAKNGFASC